MGDHKRCALQTGRLQIALPLSAPLSNRLRRTIPVAVSRDAPLSSWWGALLAGWPSLAFVERDVVVTELRDVWVSGNDGVITDDNCALYLPSHGAQLPLHDNLPVAPPEERRSDGAVRHVGYAPGEAPPPFDSTPFPLPAPPPPRVFSLARTPIDQPTAHLHHRRPPHPLLSRTS